MIDSVFTCDLTRLLALAYLRVLELKSGRKKEREREMERSLRRDNV